MSNMEGVLGKPLDFCVNHIGGDVCSSQRKQFHFGFAESGVLRRNEERWQNRRPPIGGLLVLAPLDRLRTKVCALVYLIHFFTPAQTHTNLQANCSGSSH